MEEALLCSGTSLMHLAQGVLKLCSVQSKLMTIEGNWTEMCWPVSENLGLTTGQRPKTRLKTISCVFFKYPSISPDLNPIEHL